jgi:hypothetical protein
MRILKAICKAGAALLGRGNLKGWLICKDQRSLSVKIQDRVEQN